MCRSVDAKFLDVAISNIDRKTCALCSWMPIVACRMLCEVHEDFKLNLALADKGWPPPFSLSHQHTHSRKALPALYLKLKLLRWNNLSKAIQSPRSIWIMSGKVSKQPITVGSIPWFAFLMIDQNVFCNSKSHSTAQFALSIKTATSESKQGSGV